MKKNKKNKDKNEGIKMTDKLKKKEKIKIKSEKIK